VVVEYEPQTRIEGDIQQMPPTFAVTELWQVLTGLASGRGRAAQWTVFDSVGFALEDFSALRWLRDSARELKMGTPTELVPALADPKDLFGQIARHARAHQTTRDAPALSRESA
jgi:ornithine cyclodeaminase